MKWLHLNRLLKLATFLDTLPRQKFDFGVLVNQSGLPMLEALKKGAHRCGTVACGMGWMPAVFPRQVKWTGENIRLRGSAFVEGFEAAEVFFGLTSSETMYLFQPGGGWNPFDENDKTYYNKLKDGSHPKTLAKHIRKFVAKKVDDKKKADAKKRKRVA
jgi:hypothetical protein